MKTISKISLFTVAAAGVGAGAATWVGYDLPAAAKAAVSGAAGDRSAKTADAPKTKPLPRARVVNPEAAPGAGRLALSARTAPAELAAISSRASGVISERRVDIGDRVTQGDVLALIDAPEIAQELARARATLAQNQARLDLARQNVQRAEVLAPQGHLSAQARDERLANEKSVAADVASSEAEIRRLEEVQKFQTVRAPFSGTIVARLIERGDKVSGEQSQSANVLFRIARLDELRIEVDVPQSAALRVRVGSRGRVSFAEVPGQTFDAAVTRSTGLIDPASSTMRMELTMKNPEGRIPAGLNGQVELPLEGSAVAVTVPNNTLVVRDGAQAVAIVDENSAVQFRPVRVGRDLGGRVEVVGGLTVTDRVVLSPNALLRPCDAVEVSSATAEKKGVATTR